MDRPIVPNDRRPTAGELKSIVEWFLADGKLCADDTVVCVLNRTEDSPDGPSCWTEIVLRRRERQLPAAFRHEGARRGGDGQRGRCADGGGGQRCMMPSCRPRRKFFQKKAAGRDAPDVVDRLASPHGEREDLFIRLCHAMGWEYEFKYWSGIGGPGCGNRGGPYGQFTVLAAAQVITGKPVYGAGLVEFRHPGTVVVTSAYEYRSFDGPDADPGWLSQEVDGICGGWLDAAYDMREWKNSKPVVGGNVSGRVPAGSDAELRLWLEATGL